MSVSKKAIADAVCKVMLVTPELAREWLAKNVNNFRRAQHHTVNRYAADMAADHWDLNYIPIIFSGDELVNGQHRLLACVKANVPFYSLVIFAKKVSGMNMDRGPSRTVAQWLAHEKIKNANAVAAVSRLCLAHEKGLWHLTSFGAYLLTDGETVDFAKKYHEAINASLWTGCRFGNGASPATLTALLFLGSGKKDATQNEIAQWFREKLLYGSDLCDTDPVLHLRNRFAATGGSTRLMPLMARMLLTLAWNKTVAGEPCTVAQFRIRMTGPSAQALPEKVAVAE